MPPEPAHRATARLATRGNVCRIALGASFAAGIRASDGGIDTWGGVFAGGPPPYQPADFKPKSPSVKFIALTAGGGHGVAITEDGVLEQWAVIIWHTAETAGKDVRRSARAQQPQHRAR